MEKTNKAFELEGKFYDTWKAGEFSPSNKNVSKIDLDTPEKIFAFYRKEIADLFVDVEIELRDNLFDMREANPRGIDRLDAYNKIITATHLSIASIVEDFSRDLPPKE